MSPPLLPALRAVRPLAAGAALTLALLAGCAVAPAGTVGLAELMERPAERALFEGIRAYDDGQYAQAEAALRKALAAGLRSGRDQASAHKLLAFITCTSERLAECGADVPRRARRRPRLHAEPLGGRSPAVGPGLPQAPCPSAARPRRRSAA